MSDTTPLFMFQPVVYLHSDERLVLRQPHWLSIFFWVILLFAVLDLSRWAFTWYDTGWPGFFGFPWLATTALCVYSSYRVKALALDRSGGVLRITYFIEPSRQYPLTDVVNVQLAMYRRPWSNCQLKLVLKGERSVLLKVGRGRRKQAFSALAEQLADFLRVPRADEDLTSTPNRSQGHRLEKNEHTGTA